VERHRGCRGQIRKGSKRWGRENKKNQRVRIGGNHLGGLGVAWGGGEEKNEGGGGGDFYVEREKKRGEKKGNRDVVFLLLCYLN